jgi:putative effector of murein hydrolase LrgA (UPF0299 family)
MAFIICILAVAAVCAWLGWRKWILLGLISCLLLPATVAIMAAFHEHPDGLNGSDVRRIVFVGFLAVAALALVLGALCRTIVEKIENKGEPEGQPERHRATRP